MAIFYEPRFFLFLSQIGDQQDSAVLGTFKTCCYDFWTSLWILDTWKFGGYQFLTDSAPCDSLCRKSPKILHCRQHNLNAG